MNPVALRARHFKAAFDAAAGRLPAAVAVVSSSGMLLREASMATSYRAGFEIDFAQMPRLAALLDILHNSLGYSAVAEILAPVLSRGSPTANADEVARRLHAAFNAWLAERLESPHYIRQAQRMRTFLLQRGAIAPEQIDDEAILAFWISMAQSPSDNEVEGFRLYRSAARALLRYRQALRDAAVYHEVGAAPLDERLEHTALDMREDSASAPDGNIWRCPLQDLLAPPARAVKWLTKRERLQLLNYLGGPHSTEEGAAGDLEETEVRSEGTGLNGAEHFDLRFLSTVVRTDVFGAVQSGIVARLRRQLLPQSAIDESMASAHDAAYEACAATYGAVRDQLRLEGLAAMVALLEADAPEALLLLRHLGGADAISELCGPDSHDVIQPPGARPGAGEDAQEETANEKRVRAYVTTLLRAATHGGEPGGAIRKLLAEASAAVRSVNRMGFRREDRGEPAIVLALAGR